MKYPESWEKEVAGWGDEIDEQEDVIIIRDEDGPTAVAMKGVDWVATLAANWKKIAAVAATAIAAVAAVVLLVKLLSGKGKDC